MEHLGARTWVIPEGFIPGSRTAPHVEITLFFPDREPAVTLFATRSSG